MPGAPQVAPAADQPPVTAPRGEVPQPAPRLKAPKTRRFVRLYWPALLGGLLFSASIPPFGFWVLGFAGAALIWWRLGGLTWRKRLVAGWIAGLGQFVISLWWSLDFNVYGGVVLMLFCALYPAVACVMTPPRRGRALTLTGAMVLTEALRWTWPFGGLPMGGLQLGQVSGPLAPLSRLGGPLAEVAVVWIGGCALGAVVSCSVQLARTRRGDATGPGGISATARRMTQRSALRLAGCGLAGFGLLAALGVVGARAGDGGAALRSIRVASVQGGGQRGLHKSEVSPQSVYNAQVAATAQIPEHDGGRAPSLVLWPEDVVSLDEPLDVDPAKQSLASLARQTHASLVVGVTETVSQTQFRNEIVAFSPSGEIVSRYEKVHRVPFGEYVPYRGFFKHLANLSGVPLDAIPGRGSGLLPTPAAPLGAMVSYEVFYPDRGRSATRAGGQLLIVPTNTSSYSTSQVPTQELAAARLQALSEGRDLVQAAPTGFSSFIDNQGTVLARTSLGARQVLVHEVALRDQLTLYGRLGDTPVLLIAAAMVMAGWIAALTSDDTPYSIRRERMGRPLGRRRP